MQKYHFMKSGTLYVTVEDHYYLIEELGSAEALEYVHSVYVDALFVLNTSDIMNAFIIFVCKTNKLVNVSMSNYTERGYPETSLCCFVDLLKLFKNVEKLSLHLSNFLYTAAEVNSLVKYFEESTFVDLSLMAHYHVLCDLARSIKENSSIETVRFTVNFMSSLDFTKEFMLGNKLRSLKFFNYNYSGNITGLHPLLEKITAYHPSVVKLEISTSCINTDTINIIDNIIKYTNLRTLKIGKCKADMIKTLTAALIISKVSKLRIGITAQSTFSIVNLVKLNTPIRILEIIGTEIIYDDVIEIIKELAKNTTINTFTCDRILDAGSIDSVTQTFSNILEDNYTLTSFRCGVTVNDDVDDINLNHLTNRNKILIENLRFNKTKAIF